MTMHLLLVRLASLALALCMLAAAANAQVTIEMRKITCAQYLAMTPAESEAFSAWMSGWYSYQTGKTWVDLIAYQKNVKNCRPGANTTRMRR